MPIHSRWKVPIPVVSLHKLVFGSETGPLSNQIAFYDVENPDTLFLTREAFRLWSLRLAAGLQKAGLKPGDRVLLFSGNALFYPVVFMGIMIAGGVFSGANPAYVARELAYQLKDSGAKFLICADASLESGIEAAASIGMSKDRIFRFDGPEALFEGGGQGRLGVRNWSALIESEDVGRNFRWHEPADPKDAVCALNYSSGTTGVPKGVMITHYAYVANTVQYSHLATLHPEYEERTKVSKWINFLPYYHAYGQTIFIAAAALRKVPVYIMRKFDFIKMLEAVQKYRITALTMVPPHIVKLAKDPIVKKYDLSSVREIASGAAPLSGEVIEEAEALWPTRDRRMQQGWGMTEATCSLLGFDPTVKVDPNSVGELNANCHAKIMDPDGKGEVPPGQRGEIWVQAPNLMKGYWGNERATNEIFVDGPDGRWMRTGDIAYVNEKGWFYIVDRMKELIKVKGNQVAPAELEALLLENPKIADAAVVGVTIKGDELPRAYVVLQQGEKSTEREIKDWLAKRVTRYKRLEGGVVFVDTIPKNPSGKILRKILREQAQAEVGDKQIVQSKL